ncbi:MAG: hypothetical protein ACFFBK_14535 [Promethearchaeota archaeon]
MINQEFKQNWLKILNFNKNRDILEDPEKTTEIVRIPLSPINLNVNILYHFFEILYPKFINDQQNILDIVITETDKKNKILKSYLYKTKKAGIHETIESLPEGMVRIKSFNGDELDVIFNKVQNVLIKEMGIQISSIRIFKKEAIDLINTYWEKITFLTLNKFIEQIIDLVQELLEKSLIFIYPEPIILKFFKKSLKIFENIKFQKLFKFIEQTLPEFKISLFLDSNYFKLVILLQKVLSKSRKSELSLQFFTLDDLGFKQDELNVNAILNYIQNKLKTEKVYYLKQNDIISFISEFFELSILLNKENLKFLLQKALYGYRTFEKHWNMVPRPRIYNSFIRFLIRLIGFNLNLKKTSHWAIPDLIFNYLDFSFGLNSKVLFLITDQNRYKKGKSSQENFLKNTCVFSFLLEIENSKLKKLRFVNKKSLFSSNNSSLYSIKETIKSNFGSITGIIVFDKFLIQKIVKIFILRRSKLSFLPRFKVLKLLKNPIM